VIKIVFCEINIKVSFILLLILESLVFYAKNIVEKCSFASE